MAALRLPVPVHMVALRLPVPVLVPDVGFSNLETLSMCTAVWSYMSR
jgi:hypothetical protein